MPLSERSEESGGSPQSSAVRRVYRARTINVDQYTRMETATGYEVRTAVEMIRGGTVVERIWK